MKSMIAECAIEPEVFAEWRHFQSLYEDFGAHRGRLISRFPRKWLRSVLTKAQEYVVSGANTEMQTKRIEARLSSEQFKLRRLKSSGGREGPREGESWLDAACRADPPFDLIIARKSWPSAVSMEAENLMKDEEPFARRTQDHIRRNGAAIVGAAAVLLECSREIILVDPNLRPDEPRFYNTILHLMAIIGHVPDRFEIHTKRILNRGEEFHSGPQRGKWRSKVLGELPTGWCLKVCYWDELPTGGRPHARFLLTERGGLHYDHGLDEGEGETLVALLDEPVWKKMFDNYDARNLPDGFQNGDYVFEFPFWL